MFSTTIIALAAAWLGGGFLFMYGMMTDRHAPPQTAMEMADLRMALVKGAAALTACAAFLVIWPAVFVFAYFRKNQDNLG